MKWISVAVALFVTASTGFAQSRASGIHGAVALPDGPAARATVQAKHGSTGKVSIAMSDASGSSH